MTGSQRTPAADPKRPKKTRKRELFEGWRFPKMIRDPETGEWVRPYGPRRLIVKPPRGRPETRTSEVILRLIEAEVAKRAATKGTQKITRIAAIAIAEREGLGTSEKTLQRVARWVRDPARGPSPRRKKLASQRVKQG